MASMRLTRLTSGPITVKFEAIGRSEVAVDDRAIVEDDDDFHRRFARRRRSRTPDTERRQRRAPCRRAHLSDCKKFSSAAVAACGVPSSRMSSPLMCRSSATHQHSSLKSIAPAPRR